MLDNSAESGKERPVHVIIGVAGLLATWLVAFYSPGITNHQAKSAIEQNGALCNKVRSAVQLMNDKAIDVALVVKCDGNKSYSIARSSSGTITITELRPETVR